MHVLINLCITNNLHCNIEYLFFPSHSEKFTCIKIITRQPFIYIGDFRNKLH